MKQLIWILAASVLMTACGKAKKTDEDAQEQSDDSSVSVAESAIAGLDSAVNDSEQSPDYAASSLQTSALATSCGLDRFSPRISSSATCAGTPGDKTVVADFNNCSAGKQGQFILNGQVWLEFDSPSTCNEWINGGAFPTGGNVTRTSNAFIANLPGGSYITTNSNAHTNYKGESVSGGVQTSFNASGANVEILGLHRTRTLANGWRGFDHSVRTTSPLVVVGSRLSAERRLESGTVIVDHNRVKQTSSVSFNGLVWDRTCCHPINGSVTLSSTLSTNNVVIDFNTGVCGEAKVTGPNGTQNVELSVCE